VILVGVPVLLGLHVAARRRLVDALRDRATRTEREQHLGQTRVAVRLSFSS
jgi:hypothetical protein